MASDGRPFKAFGEPTGGGGMDGPNEVKEPGRGNNSERGGGGTREGGGSDSNLQSKKSPTRGSGVCEFEGSLCLHRCRGKERPGGSATEVREVADRPLGPAGGLGNGGGLNLQAIKFSQAQEHPSLASPPPSLPRGGRGEAGEWFRLSLKPSGSTQK